MNLLLFNLKTDADDTVLGFTTDWINELARHCDHITVITMMAGRIAVAANVTVWSAGKEKGWSEPRRAVEFYRLLRQALCARRFDACFAHMMPLFAVMGWPLLRANGIPITLWYAHSHVSLLLRMATRLAEQVVSPSQGSFRIRTPKLHVTGHGIDTARFTPAERPRAGARVALLTVGRIAPVKRLELMIEALRLLEGLSDRVVLRVIGDPLSREDQRYQERLRQLVNSYGLSDRIIFQAGMPFQTVHLAYQASDIFLNCSDTDSVDKSVLEAMSCGLPVITSNQAFQEAWPTDLACNWVIPKGNATALAEKLTQLILRPKEQRQELGLRFRRDVEIHHSLPTLVDRIMNLTRGTTKDTCR